MTLNTTCGEGGIQFIGTRIYIVINIHISILYNIKFEIEPYYVNTFWRNLEHIWQLYLSMNTTEGFKHSPNQLDH